MKLTKYLVSPFFNFIFAASQEEIIGVLKQRYPQASPEQLSQASANYKNTKPAEWILKELLNGHTFQEIQQVFGEIEKYRAELEANKKPVSFIPYPNLEALKATINEVANKQKLSPQEVIFNALRRDFPDNHFLHIHFLEDIAKKCVSHGFDASIAKWIYKQVEGGFNPEYIYDLVDDFFENKEVLRQLGYSPDLLKYNSQSVKEALKKARNAPKTNSQITKNIPKEVVDMAMRASTSVLRSDFGSEEAKRESFQWILQLYRDQVKKTKQDPQSYPNLSDTLKQTTTDFIEDKITYVKLLADYYQIKAKLTKQNKPIAPLLDFESKQILSEWTDSNLTEQEKQVKYTLSGENIQNAGKIPGIERLNIPNFNVFKITEWTPEFSENLCKMAAWCVTDKRAFDGYEFGPNNPLFLILDKSNRQIALVNFATYQVKNVNDNILDGQKAKNVFPAIEILANKYNDGIVPHGEDFSIFSHTDYRKEHDLNTLKLISSKFQQKFNGATDFKQIMKINHSYQNWKDSLWEIKRFIPNIYTPEIQEKIMQLYLKYDEKINDENDGSKEVLKNTLNYENIERLLLIKLENPKNPTSIGDIMQLIRLNMGKKTEEKIKSIIQNSKDRYKILSEISRHSGYIDANHHYVLYQIPSLGGDIWYVSQNKPVFIPEKYQKILHKLKYDTYTSSKDLVVSDYDPKLSQELINYIESQGD